MHDGLSEKRGGDHRRGTATVPVAGKGGLPDRYIIDRWRFTCKAADGRTIRDEVLAEVSPPEIVELAAIQLGIAHRAVDALVPEVVLQAARIMPGLRQREAACMAQHVRMHAEAKARRLASARDQLAYAGARKGRPALSDKHRPMPPLSGVPMQAAKRAQLVASNWMRGGLAEFGAPHVQFLLREINRTPIQGAGLRDPQPMAEHGEDQRRVPGAIAVVPGDFHEPHDLVFGKVLALAIGRIRLAPAACCDRASVSVVDSKQHVFPLERRLTVPISTVL